MLYDILRKLQGQKPEGPQASRVFGLESFQGTTFTMLPQDFPKNTILFNSRISKLDFLTAKSLRGFVVGRLVIGFSGVSPFSYCSHFVANPFSFSI